VTSRLSRPFLRACGVDVHNVPQSAQAAIRPRSGARSPVSIFATPRDRSAATIALQLSMSLQHDAFIPVCGIVRQSGIASGVAVNTGHSVLTGNNKTTLPRITRITRKQQRQRGKRRRNDKFRENSKNCKIAQPFNMAVFGSEPFSLLFSRNLLFVSFLPPFNSLVVVSRHSRIRGTLFCLCRYPENRLDREGLTVTKIKLCIRCARYAPL